MIYGYADLKLLELEPTATYLKLLELEPTATLCMPCL